MASIPQVFFQFGSFIPQGSAAMAPLKLALAITIGLILGAIRIRGIRLGVSAVLFSSLGFAQLGVTIPGEVLAFVRDFSLILFVYAIGLQVGPGFIASFRAEGLRLNILALIVVLLGAGMTAVVVIFAGLSRQGASGLYAGAFTTTAGLAAGQEALRQLLADSPDRAQAALAATGLAYAVSYPLGLVGPSLVILSLQKLFGVRMDEERAALAAAEHARRPPLVVLDIEVTHSEQAGKTLREHALLRGKPIVFSRLYRDGKVSVPNADTVIQPGDVYRAVGLAGDLADLTAALGRDSTMDLSHISGGLQRVDLVVTKARVLRRPLHELDLIRRTGVTIARISRAGVDLVPSASLTLKFGDRVTAVGPEDGIKMVEGELGNCQDTLNRSQILPVFLGIVIGIVIGAIPLKLPGMNVAMQIGLAGGPMLAAIALSQLGNIGSVIWYMPVSANQIIRDFGLSVFLACVGFQSGGHFLQRAMHGGIPFIVWGAAITIIPVFIVGCFARYFWRINFVTLGGWVAGAMTSSPALLFANETAGSDAPAVAYATVAPLCMLSPIICAQLLAIGVMR
jgi:putative transport protein